MKDNERFFTYFGLTSLYFLLLIMEAITTKDFNFNLFFCGVMIYFISSSFIFFVFFVFLPVEREIYELKGQYKVLKKQEEENKRRKLWKLHKKKKSTRRGFK